MQPNTHFHFTEASYIPWIFINKEHSLLSTAYKAITPTHWVIIYTIYSGLKKWIFTTCVLDSFYVWLGHSMMCFPIRMQFSPWITPTFDAAIEEKKRRYFSFAVFQSQFWHFLLACAQLPCPITDGRFGYGLMAYPWIIAMKDVWAILCSMGRHFLKKQQLHNT